MHLQCSDLLLDGRPRLLKASLCLGRVLGWEVENRWLSPRSNEVFHVGVVPFQPLLQQVHLLVVGGPIVLGLMVGFACVTPPLLRPLHHCRWLTGPHRHNCSSSCSCGCSCGSDCSDGSPQSARCASGARLIALEPPPCRNQVTHQRSQHPATPDVNLAISCRRSCCRPQPCTQPTPFAAILDGLCLQTVRQRTQNGRGAARPRPNLSLPRSRRRCRCRRRQWAPADTKPWPWPRCTSAATGGGDGTQRHAQAARNETRGGLQWPSSPAQPFRCCRSKVAGSCRGRSCGGCGCSRGDATPRSQHRRHRTAAWRRNTASS
mmetsp:Transcript_26111/g.69395  ORF Transcript_26111/g.69395 Transcript_26111/m.69395 type:complete len:319 (+) Transcript_26111:240-1196(+)